MISRNTNIKKTFLTVIGIFMMGLSFSYGHAIWIETAAMGKKGVAQEIKVYFGEFATADISKTNEWFSDLGQFELEVAQPDGSKIKLPFNANGDHFAASFTPKNDGLYQVTLHKVASEVSYGYKLDYMASAHVQVGHERIFGANGLPVSLRPAAASYEAGKAIDLSILMDNALAGDKEITVISPNTWTKKLYLDDKSSAHFTPIWPGKYLIETTITDKNKGDFDGKSYDVNYRCHTYMIEVK